MKATQQKTNELLERLRNIIREHDKGNLGFRSISIEDDVDMDSAPIVNVKFQVLIRKIAE